MRITPLVALAVLGLCLAVEHAARTAQSVAEPPRRVALRGIVVADGDKHAPPTYALLVESAAGRPPAVATYALATTFADQPRRLSLAVNHAVVVIGRVGERGDRLFLFVEEILETPPQ